MKKVSFITILVFAVFLLIPPALGMLAQSRVEESLAQATKQSAAYLDLTLEDYDSGWFSSNGKIRFKFSDAYIEANPALQQVTGLAAGFSQDIDIAHGPVLFGQQTNLGLGAVAATLDGSDNPAIADLLAKSGNEYLLRSSLVLGFTGMGDIAVDAPGFQINDPDQQLENVIFAGASATGSIDLSDMHVVMDGQMNGLSLSGSDGEAVIERTTFSADMAYPASDPYGLGSGTFALDRVVAISEQNTALDMRTATIAFASNKDDADKVSVSLSYAIGQLTMEGATVEDMEIDVLMTGLDAATLIKMQDFTNKVSSGEDAATQAFAQMAEPAYELLASGVAMHIDPVRFTYNDMPFHAAIKIRAKPDSLPPKSTFTFDNPQLLSTLFAVELDLTIDRALARELALPQVKQQLLAGIPQDTQVDDTQLEEMARVQTPMMMGALVGQGILREDGSNYVVSASYDNGALVLNGNPFPLGALLSQ